MTALNWIAIGISCLALACNTILLIALTRQAHAQERQRLADMADRCTPQERNER